MKNQATTFGDLRSRLTARPVTTSTWRQLAGALYHFQGSEDLEAIVLPYCAEAMASWPETLTREAPKHWIFEDSGEPRMYRHPALGLATHLTIAGPLTPGLVEALLDTFRHGLALSLTVESPEAGPDTLIPLLMSPCWSRLLRLHVRAPLSESVTTTLFALPWFHDLQHLGLCGGMSDRQFSKFPDRFTALRHLELGGNLLSEPSVMHLRAMESLSTLEELNLMENALERYDEGLFEMPASSIPNEAWKWAWDEYYWGVFE